MGLFFIGDHWRRLYLIWVPHSPPFWLTFYTVVEVFSFPTFFFCVLWMGTVILLLQNLLLVSKHPMTKHLSFLDVTGIFHVNTLVVHNSVSQAMEEKGSERRHSG